MLLFACVSANSQVSKNLRMVWNDEFNGNTLDASKWKVPPAWNRQGGSYWSADNHEMTGNGQVRLSVTEKNGKVYCGALRTHNLFDKKYGYFEVRCKVPQMKGGWAAFWMMPYGNKPGNSGNDGTEIDIFESINGWKGHINHALHWDGYGPEHKHAVEKMTRPDLYDDKYHVFGMMWTPQEYIFYIDNVETWRTSEGGVSDVKQYLKLTLEVSGSTWPGDWKEQQIKPIHWLVDYVRVYDYQSVPEENVSLEFTSLVNNQSFNVGDNVQMHTSVSGTKSQLDELRFYTKRGNEPYQLRKTSNITSANTYWYNYFPTLPGNYKVKVEGFKNGNKVVTETANITVNSDLGPLNLNFATLKAGDVYSVGDAIKMDVNLSGSLSQADEIQFLVKKDGNEFTTQKSINLNNATSYNYSHSPSEAGTYSFRITALKNNQYVTHVVVNGIIVESEVEPLSLSFSTLKSGANHKVGDLVNIGVTLSGDFSEADQIQFLARTMDGVFEVQKTQNLTGLNEYDYNWTATESGEYAFRVTALKDGKYVTHVVAGGVLVEKIIEPLSMASTSVISSDNYKVGDALNLSVSLSGDLSDADEIQYLIKKDDGEFVIQKTDEITDLTDYNYTWTTSQAGNYILKVTALNKGQHVTQVLIGEVTVEEILPPLSMGFTSIKSGDTYETSTEIPVNIALSGNLLDADEVVFLVREGSDKWTVKHKISTNGASDYTYNWTPSQSGTYSLRVTAKKNGSYVTHAVIGGVEIESNLDLEYLFLEDGAKFNVGNKVKMNVKLLGDYSNIDQLKFVAQKIGETGTVVRTSKVRQKQSAYGFKWTAKAGNYTLKVAAFSKGVIVTNVKANITVENPPKLTFRFLKNGQSYSEGSKVKMHIRASGNMSKADLIKFVVQKDGGFNEVVRSYSVNPSKKAYNKTWVAKEAGNYKLKAEAYKDGVFVTITVANIKVTKKLQSRSYESNEVNEFVDDRNTLISSYPNPTSGQVSIDFGSLKAAEIRVSNSSGQIVYQKLGLSGIHQFELKGKPGLYFIEIKSETENQVLKLIKR